MTFIRRREGWLHLAVLLDLSSRRAVARAMDERPGLDLHVVRRNCHSSAATRLPN